MLLIPDPNTAVIDPFRQHPTLNINCFVRDPLTGESYSPRPALHRRRRRRSTSSRPASPTPRTSGPKPSSTSSTRCASTRTSTPATTSSTRSKACGTPDASASSTARRTSAYKPRYKEGYFPVPPMDQFQDLRSEMVRVLEQVGIAIEVQHHEVGTAGQAEIDMRFDTLAVHGRQADALQVRREERRARRGLLGDVHAEADLPWTTARACTCTSRCGRAASRCSSTRRATPVCPTWRAGTSAVCSKHAPAILAFSNPTTNSYKRLVPGYEAPVNLVYSQRNRSASVRIPLYSKSPKAKRLEFRCPDPSCNPYLAFSAMLMAGLDGIQNRIEPPTPVDQDLYDLPPEELAKVPQVPGSLERGARRARSRPRVPAEAATCSPPTSSTRGSSTRREHEIDQVQLRPHPWEFYLYYDI